MKAIVLSDDELRAMHPYGNLLNDRGVARLRAVATIARDRAIKEVVEWISEHAPEGNQYWNSLLFPKLLLDVKKWEAQKKEWRIKCK